MGVHADSNFLGSTPQNVTLGHPLLQNSLDFYHKQTKEKGVEMLKTEIMVTFGYFGVLFWK
jgi:hypothetical protein